VGGQVWCLANCYHYYVAQRRLRFEVLLRDVVSLEFISSHVPVSLELRSVNPKSGCLPSVVCARNYPVRSTCLIALRYSTCTAVQHQPTIFVPPVTSVGMIVSPLPDKPLLLTVVPGLRVRRCSGTSTGFRNGHRVSRRVQRVR
jgi:hypothetical protein